MIGSEFDYKALFGNEDYEANCRSLREKGPNIVVFTQGSKGCLGVGEEGFLHSPPYQVEVVDTVGAGDVFHGAFIAGLLQGYTTKETARACQRRIGSQMYENRRKGKDTGLGNCA